MTFANDRLYLRTNDGVVILAEASQSAFKERSRFIIPGAVNGSGATYPVIVGGHLYLRDDDQLRCYDIQADALEKRRKQPLTVLLAPPLDDVDKAPRERTLRSVFVPTPQDIVEKMLELAEIKKSDVVADLGSGDGRLIITASKRYGCKSIGYELDKDLVESSLAQAESIGMKSLVTIEMKDLFTADLSGVDVLTLYLLPEQLAKLTPQIKQMKPGSRIVSHQFPLPGFTPDKEIKLESSEDGVKHTIYLWTMPLNK